MLAVTTFAFGCASHQQKVASGRPHPTFNEFVANIDYPYHATAARQQQMERAVHMLRKGMTEAEVLQIIGPPDYKARWFYPRDTLRGEVWHYVHTWERPIMPDYTGKMIAITLDESVRPRTLLDFDSWDFGVQRPE